MITSSASNNYSPLAPCGCYHPQERSTHLANTPMGTFAKKFQHLGLLYITKTVLDWANVFHLERYAEIVLGSLRFCIDHKWFELYAYVLMPNHIHLIFFLL